MTKTLALFKCLSTLVLLFSLQSAWAQQEKLRGTIDGGVVRGKPIAIVPFKVLDGSNVEHKIHEVVAFDLDASGKFESIPVKDFLSTPSKDEEVRYKDWRFINAEILVIGEIWNLGSAKYEVQFRIYDVVRQQQIGKGKRISGLSKKDLRTAAHVVSDHVYAAFAGKQGAFQSKMAYVKRSEIEYQRFRYRLMVADWDGYGAREIYASWNPILSPDWSPDGKSIAFVGFSPDGTLIKKINLRTLDEEIIAEFKGVNSAPAWSPDGSKIAYSSSRHGSPDVFIYDVLTRQHERVNVHYAIDTEPAWSPNGSSFLFTSSRTGKPQIYNYDLKTQSVSRMTFEGTESANASYDQSGKQIVMVHDGGRIAIMDEKNGRMTMLTNAKFDESPSFSPNGDMVLYATELNYEPMLMVASSDGRIKTPLEFVSGDVREPAWSTLLR